jgi:NAD(P)H-dependent FMN reductase/ketosteroid isomerase-like protein
MYNQDLDANPPISWKRFRREVAASDAILFVTPEYNRSIPGCLKNALDVASRPDGHNSWDGKPAAIVSVTPYQLGAFGANHALRQALVFLSIPAMQQPEAYIGKAEELFDSTDEPNEQTAQLFTRFMASFAEWTGALHGASGQSFDEFLQQRQQAAAAYVRGDVAPLDQLVATEGEASFFPPGGGVVTEADTVKARYDADAKSFGSFGKSNLKAIQSGASGGLGFWTGLQDAEVELAGKKQSMTLRITEVFTRQNGSWQLIHRHADMNAEARKER